jgi:isocitrate lyase
VRNPGFTHNMQHVSTPIELEHEWHSAPRWRGVERAYPPEDVVRLRGTVRI